MHRFSLICFGLAASIAFACGAPAELDEGLFPDTYADDETGSTGSGGAPSLGGTGSIPAGGAAPIGSGGSLPAGVSGAPPISGGSGGSGVAAGGGGAQPSGECPSDITVLFNRPIEQGGCAGAACHVPGATRPDLVSPDPLARLLNVQSSCNGLSYVGASMDQSLLALKITSPPDGCGLTMPFFMPAALSDADEACILAWVADNSGG